TDTARKSRLRIEDYLIGWVCAVFIERAAAMVMLDEEHLDIPGPSEYDTNTYTLGRIGNHNVVIVCLPAGQMGTTAAATAVAQMMSRFTAIRLRLVVGIGGGVPSGNADIRLGDVVISEPHIGNGGVVQYDFGKAMVDDGFINTSHLNKPPQTLLNVLGMFKSNRSNGNCNLANHLSKFYQLHISSVFANAFGSRELPKDILFEAGFDHVGGQGCDSCMAKGREVAREPRANGSREIQIHYGTIASG